MNIPGQPIPPDNEAIEAMAATWLAQREEGFTPEQEIEFLRWRLADPQHSAALQRLEETCTILEQLPLLKGDTRLESPGAMGAARSITARRPFSFRRLVIATTALAAVLAITVVVWSGLPHDSHGQTYATTSEGYQRVLLPDSSVAQLNGGTQLTVDFTAANRRVTLAAGEANFHVAKDSSRPFVVTARGVSVRAVGTAFNVRLNEASIDVLVTEGVVRIEREGGTPLAPLVLASCERAVVGAGPTTESEVISVERLDGTRIQATLAWLEPSMVFVEATLADVISRFNAHNRVQLELGDRDLGTRVVGGTFRQNDVETFVRLLEGGGDIVADRHADGRIVLRRAR